ncbi:hypothetical protein [Pseudomonas sp. 1152_12]|uniref:hypothetical protein n=1 Tax=Pseudomonas sp. 1152_12 TaxID=2604455 RepID=UPI0040637F2A
MNVSSVVTTSNVVSGQLSVAAATPATVPSNSFKSLSNVGMATYLKSNFSTFVDPASPGIITRASLQRLAGSGPQQGASADPSEFARALLENQGLMDQIGHAGKIPLASVTRYVQLSHGQFSRQSNIELTRHLLNNFRTFSQPHEFDSGEVENVVTRQTLERVKNSSSQSRYTNEDRKFASELLARTSLVSTILDGLGGSGFDNLISHTVLREWLILGRRTTI